MMVVELVVVLTALRLVTVCVCVRAKGQRIQWKWILMESIGVNRKPLHVLAVTLIDYSTPFSLFVGD